jgi:NAD(P)-dependent dehydrogenase (short-subunit alcohol dehydrogenase family)
VAKGDRVVISGRDLARTQEIAASIGEGASAVAVDISEPETIKGSLASIEGPVNGLVLAAIERDANTIRDYDIARATRLVILKLVGYSATVHALSDRLVPSVDTGIVLFGGRAKDMPYPGSTTVSTINGGVEGMTMTLALELAPIRVNALHPGIIGDSPFWANKPAGVLDGYQHRTPGGELATMADVVGGVQFLLDNRGISGTSIFIDRGWRLT